MGELILANSANKVTVRPHAEGYRLRWRIEGKRPELYISAQQANAKQVAARLGMVIEQDLLTGAYDGTLRRYKALIKQASLYEHLQLQEVDVLPQPESNRKKNSRSKPIHYIEAFNAYLASKSLNPASPDLSSYYIQTRAMLAKWGTFDAEHAPVLLSQETFGPKTFNDRRNCLTKFFAWMVRKGKLPDNPLQEVSTKKRERNTEQRKPFADAEVLAILEALRTDKCRKKCSRYSHAQYYPMVAFMLQTGVRNAEAIGLQVGDVLWDTKELRICRALARTAKGTNEAARKEKGTKTNNVRYIPMNAFLTELLQPLCTGRDAGALVFTNKQGRMIDDRMFQRRVFKPLLKALGISERDLYSCRHTFATRAVKTGMKAYEVAYLMGDNLQTVIANYYHKERVSVELPSIAETV